MSRAAPLVGGEEHGHGHAHAHAQAAGHPQDPLPGPSSRRTAAINNNNASQTMNGLQSANAVYAQDGTRSAPMSASLNLVNGGVGHIDEQQRVMQNGQANGNHDDTGNGMVNATNGQGDNDGDNDDDEEENEDASSSQQGQKQNKPNGAGLARHGFDSSEETLRELESRYFLYYTDTRHTTVGRAKFPPYISPPDWRTKDKVKTVAGALVICLRIGFDPPDVIKTTPCARLETWVDTGLVGKERAMEQISTNIEKQFEQLAVSSKAKFSVHMDPAHEDLRKLCVSLRRKARGERALFYYNGHGVPRPTSSGEIWVFNRQYTQYIPVAVADIVGYLSGPSAYIWDCSNAGHIIAKVQELQNLPEGKFPAPSATTAPASNGQSQTQQPSLQGTSTPDSTTHATGAAAAAAAAGTQVSAIQDVIQLAACQPHETLPMNPDLPADLFTSCITSPIEMSLRFFILHNPLRSGMDLNTGMKVPGRTTDRKTPLGELMWIFTSVTDTIAWNIVPRHLFQRLFRHDLVLAALFRGFLLAERVMRRYNCTPMSVPAIPSCANHPLWDSWDLALDRCLSQMPALIAFEEKKKSAERRGEPPPQPVIFSHSYFFADHLSAFSVWIDQGTARTVDAAQAYLEQGKILSRGYKRTLPETFAKLDQFVNGAPSPDRQAINGVASHPNARVNGVKGSTATATGGAITANGQVGAVTPRPQAQVPIVVANLKRIHKTLRVTAEAPEHLPVLLQVLLSQHHRLRALMLLCKFLDLGPWAVEMGLAIGIFPYVLKLLQAPGPELRPVLIYIWARILGIYRLCQEDLAKAAGLPNSRNGGRPELPFHYFAGVLDPHQQMLVIPNVSEHRAMCAFIISVFMRDYPFGQNLALTSVPAMARSNVFESCLYHLNDEDPLLRQWSALCIGILWDDFDEAKGLGVKMKAHSDLSNQIHTDAVPEVRASVLFALGILLGCTGADLQSNRSQAGRPLSGSARDRTGLTEQWQGDEELGIVMATIKAQGDGSPLVRKELLIMLSAIVYNHRGSFVVAAYEHALERTNGIQRNPAEVFEERMNIMEQSVRYMDPHKANTSTYSSEFKAIMFMAMYRVILDFAADPFPDIAERAALVLDYIHELLLDSDLPSAVDPSAEDLASEEEDDDIDAAQQAVQHAQKSSSGTDGAASERLKYPLGTALKAIAKLGLAEPHISRFPSSPVDITSPRSAPGTVRAGSTLPTSKSVAHFDDAAQVKRAMRRTGSADDLLRQGQSSSKHGGQSSTKSSTSRGSARHPRTPKVSVQDVKYALIKSDEDRLKRLRQTPAPVVVRPARVAAPVELAANPAHSPPPWPPYVPGRTATDDAGRPTTREMPLRSELFDWSTEYFINPQMKEKESDEPGSVEYNERHWRRERNEKVLLATQPLKEAAGRNRWDQLDAEFDNVATPEHFCFHQFEPHLATSDAGGVIRLYDWQLGRSLNRFVNTPGRDDRFDPRTKITGLRFINDDDTALLLTGTADGAIRVYRDYDTPKPSLVTAWRALTQLVPSTHEESGLVIDWQQGRGRLLAGGNARDIKIWDATTEVCTRDILTRSNSCVTSIASDQVAGDIVVAGFGDGAIRAYDTRLPPRETMVKAWKGFHRSWVKKIQMQRGGNRELLSGSLTGEVCLWDIRANEPLRIVQAHQGGLTQLAVHEHAPVYATGSENGIVKVWNILGNEPISRFRNTSSARPSFRDGSVHPVVSMMFHPHEMVLGVGATDAKLNIYHCQF